MPVNMTCNKQPNELIHEQSPYLRQHAWNPVLWLPWSEKAIEKANREQKPIFLSSGYSTCHWCHVMEKECFENPSVAEILNSCFVPVKVDREERPDIDRLYMTYVQATTGSGGWPMSVWLTPDLKPFYGGGYFPPEDRYGRPGFVSLLHALCRAWKEDRKQLIYVADSMMDQLAGFSTPAPGKGKPDTTALDRAASLLTGQFDPVYGGFGPAPKFPRPSVLSFLFRYGYYTGKDDIASLGLFTLRKMAEGGIHDHLGAEGTGGGGFCRYSTDARWHVPHFEKMLYDNAQLAIAYLEAYQLTSDRLFAETAQDIFNYLLCDMLSPGGGFFSAEDADSAPERATDEKKEGAFYTWTSDEIDNILDPDEQRVFRFHYHIETNGNVIEDPHGEFGGKNILFARETITETAHHAFVSEQQCRTLLESSKQKLLAQRLKRPRPARDEKIITGWNGLVLSALARGSRVLEDHRLPEHAETTAAFMLEHLVTPEGELYRRHCNGQSAIPGKADDYAFMIRGLLDLYEASLERDYLAEAIRLQESMDRLFLDMEHGGYYNAPSTDASLPVRMKDDFDGAEPSANSVAVENLARLWTITEDEQWHQKAEHTLACFSSVLDEDSSRLPHMLNGLFLLRFPAYRLQLRGNRNDDRFGQLKRVVDRRLLADVSLDYDEKTGTASGPAEAILCGNGLCHPPATGPDELENLLSATLKAYSC
ncbi:thioredoxin domain-containing protein [Prosthecochloris sp. HL-130-GSB]|uniref:thioredoxin domain-containing protein n=1 Tax=Prosthecochloris sp. HL-130-GSB TaxID=1974213 RepID=UPI001E4FCE50|nr:thioredoxin domain-containing protein [Prosthecochloris sp. HL-130-GSB]